MNQDNTGNRHSSVTPCPPPGTPHERKFMKYFLLVLFILALAAFFSVIRIFVLQIVLAAVFATLFYPLFKRLLRIFNGRKGLASFITCMLILLGILLPILAISNLVVEQALELYRSAEPQVREVIENNDTSDIIRKLRLAPLEQFLSIDSIDWRAALGTLLNYVGLSFAKLINKMSRATIGIIIDLFIILFSVFYFLRDGGSILLRIKNVIPLNDQYKEMIIERFLSISNATVRGVLLIALIQSTLATITLWAFGIDGWMVWGAVMLVFSVIPFVGTGAVLIPTGIIKILSGSVPQGVAIILISVFVISLVDNFLRPRIVGHRAGMHDLLVFFSTLGGISVFGPFGFIIGPLVTAIFLTILEIYSIEFQQYLPAVNRLSESVPDLPLPTIPPVERSESDVQSPDET